MATLRNLSLGICTPRLVPPPQPRKFPKPSAVSGGPSSLPSNFSASRWADRLLSDFQFLPTTTTTTISPETAEHDNTALPPYPPSPAPPERHVSMPIDFYRVLGAETHFLGDGIRRAFEARVSKPPQYGYSEESLISRRQILQAASQTLSNPQWRREYNQGLAEDEFDTILTQVPWDNVPGALCVLQESGETEVVLQIGETLLKERLPKSFKQDVVLAMALAYIDLSRDAMASSPPNYITGCEALERALKLLQEEGASNLAPDLQAQIDETIEEINPMYVLELLSLPLGDQYRTKRAEGLQGVRNILWAVGGGGAAAAITSGFTREDFMKEAFLRMTAIEQVDLFVATPSNIPAENFEVCGVALALVAQAFVSKKPRLIQDADNLFQQLQQTNVAFGADSYPYTVRENREVDFALGRGLCSLLIGEVDECRKWLGLDTENSPYRNPSIVNFVMENANNENDDDVLPGLCKLLETWLMEVVFPRFRETENIQFKLGDYYDDPTVLRYLERLEGGGSGGSTLAAAAAIARIGAEATAVLDSVKVSAIQALQKVFPLSKREESDGEMKKSVIVVGDEDVVGGQSGHFAEMGEKNGYSEIEEQERITNQMKDASVKLMCAGVAVGLLAFACLQYLPLRRSSLSRNQNAGSLSASDVAGTIEEKKEEIGRMDGRVAEGIVRKWQEIKSEALGPDHELGRMSEVLDGEMLRIWRERAMEIEERGWWWEYNLLDMSIDSVTVSVDGRRATVETTLHESAKLTDTCHPQNNDSYSTTYTTRYDMSFSNCAWKITRGAVLRSS